MQSIIRNYNQRLILARGVFVYSARAHPFCSIYVLVRLTRLSEIT